jgi:hypothetical protein
MKRADAWPELLDAFIESRKLHAFAWGEHDCCLFAADAVLAMTGVDLAADFRGKYHDAKGALEMLDGAAQVPGEGSLGNKLSGGVEGLAERIALLHEIKEVSVAYAQRGDVVFISGAGAETHDQKVPSALGIVGLAGDDFWTPGEFTLLHLRLDIAARAWRI